MAAADTRLNYRVVLGTFFTLLLATECLLRLFAPSWILGARSLPLVSAPLLQERLSPAPGRKILLLIGDSVFYGTAMRERGMVGWKEKTPGAFIQASLGPSWRVLDLSDEGLHGADMLALWEAGKRAKPDAVVLELNYRMLAAQAGTADGVLTRPFLAQWLPAEFRSLVHVAEPKDKAMEALQQRVSGASAAFRYAPLADAMLFPGGLRQVFSAWVKKIFPEQEGVDSEALLGIKIRPYYEAPPAGKDHLGLAAFQRLRDSLAASKVPSLVFLTPQNLELVDEYLDKKAMQANRSRLKSVFGAPWRDWAAERPGGQFLDHCHWDAAGNEALAKKILGELKLP